MNRYVAIIIIPILLATALAQTVPTSTAPSASAPADPSQITITFDKQEIGKPLPSITEKGVEFKLAWDPQDTQAAGRIMFFPHLKTDKKGILNAMANEQAIPIRANFPAPGASSITLELWATVACPVLIEAYDKDGKFLAKASRDAAPMRTSPADPIPTFELTVKSPGPPIAYILFGGARNGEALVADEIHFTPAK